MPQIPASQFDRLLQQDMPAFVDKTLAVVRDSHPTYRQSDDMLRDSIRAGFKRALQHGLTTDEQLMEYVLVMFASAPNFDQHPMIARVLGDQRFPIEVRWERIFEEDFDDFWGEISEPDFYDGEYWKDPTQPKAKPLGPHEQPTADDWAELVVGLKQAQGPGPYPPATQQELDQAKKDLVEAIKKRRETTPEGWDVKAREAAKSLSKKRP